MRFDEDAARSCVDCALDRHQRCLNDDPAPLGRRECCCGAAADVTTIPKETDG